MLIQRHTMIWFPSSWKNSAYIGGASAIRQLPEYAMKLFLIYLGTSQYLKFFKFKTSLNCFNYLYLFLADTTINL